MYVAGWGTGYIYGVEDDFDSVGADGLGGWGVGGVRRHET